MKLPGPLHPHQLAWVSPTNADTLRRCPLQSAFDASSEHKAIVMHGPAARLGSVCHAVLEDAAKGCFDGLHERQFPETFERGWRKHLDAEEQAALRSPLERHFGPAMRWPSYAIKRAYLYRMVKKIAASRAVSRTGQNGHSASTGTAQVERVYVGFSGRLRGRADHVMERDGAVEIEDYKSGAILEQSEDGTSQLKSKYRHQLLLYAALHWEETGIWPRAAHLISLTGERFSITIEPNEALALAKEVLMLLDQFNASVAAGASLEGLARPSKEVCATCPYKATCDPFWAAVEPSWDIYGHACLEGELEDVLDLGRNGYLLEIQVKAGNIMPGMRRLRAISGDQFPEVRTISPSTRIRVLSARLGSSDDHPDLMATDFTQLWQVN